MRFINLVLAYFCIATISVLATPDYKVLSDTNVGTNAAYSVTLNQTVSSEIISGELLGVYVDFSGESSPDVDIDLITTNGVIPAFTLLSVDDLTADAWIPVRKPALTTGNASTGLTNSDTKIPLINNLLELRVYDSSKTNVNVTVYVIFEP